MPERSSKKATIRDVADLVGVHHSTVSRALNPEQKQRISPNVVREVEKAAKKLGYFPNIAASALKRNRSFAIGMLVPDITNPVFPPIIRGVQDAAEAAGFTVIFTSTDDAIEKEEEALRMMRGRSIDGIIIATANLNDPIVDSCVKNDIPFVLVNRTVGSDTVNAVIVDEEYGVRLALDHLVALGHKKIAHIAGQDDTSTGRERARFFKKYMRSHGLDDSLIEATSRYTIKEGASACAALLRRRKKFTAVLASNDLLALGCMDALAEAGMTVPGDVSVIGGNDIPLLSRMTPALTTNRIPKYDMGSRAASMLLDEISGKQREPVTLRLQPRLVVRDSTGPLRSRTRR